MRSRRFLIPFLLLALSSTCSLFGRSALSVVGASPARLVRARILRGGELLLQASTSDDGKPDVDEVWDYLGTLELQPTEAFERFVPEEEAGGFTLHGTPGDPRGSSPYHERDLVLSVAYGGEVEARRLRLERTGDGWRVEREEMQRLFSYRRITRGQARGLKQPGREQ